MTEEEYQLKKYEVKAKFTQEFFQEHQYHPLFNATYEMLIRDMNPYQIIEQLINANSELFQISKRLIENSKP